MQGITVALSFEGIKYLVEGICAPTSYLENAINNTSLNDYSITDDSLGEAWININENAAEDCTQIHVYLSHGTISNFKMSSSGSTIKQQQNGTFLLSFSSGSAFNANYTWNENWSQQDEYYEDSVDGNGSWVPQGNPYGKSAGPFNFSLGVGSLDTTATFTFTYDSNSKTWQLPVSTVTTSPSSPTPNIPSGSVLQHSTSQGCNAQLHLEQGAVDSLDKGDDFHTALMNGVFNHPLASIPASGQLFQDPTKGTITFAFGIGDSQLAFPNDQGLTVGVTGISTYTPPGQSQPQQYPGTPPSNLSVPAVPTDGHHLQMYVSDYVINGLYWAFANAGQLTETVTPATLQSMGLDPDVLDVATYFNSIPTSQPLYNELFPYQLRQMYAKVSPQLDSKSNPIPPTVTFGTVYSFQNNPSKLQASLPDVWNAVQGTVVASQTYATTAALEKDLKLLQIDSSLFSQIEGIIGAFGIIVTHNLEVTCTIQVPNPPSSGAPYFTCTMQRYDILSNLKLGISTSGKAQTLQFDHTLCKPLAVLTMTGSNFITDSNDLQYFASLWPNSGEPAYEKLLTKLGNAGAPIPIMQGFQFVFEEALINLEQGYIGILANVEFTS